MTRLNLCLLSLALLPYTAPAFAQADISGRWEIMVDPGQGQAGGSTIDATIKQVGEAVTGSVDSPLGRVAFTGTFLNDVLSINYALPLAGQTLEAVMTGTLDGDSMIGKLIIGGLGEVPWRARRKPEAEDANASATSGASPDSLPPLEGPVPTDANGSWDIVFKLRGQGDLPMSATFTQAADQVTGTVRAPMGDAPVTGTMIGRALKISFNVQTPLGDMPVTMTGDLGEQGFVGTANIAGLGEAEWIGRPAKN